MSENMAVVRRTIYVENRFSEEFIDEVRLHSDIVSTISEYVSLQRKGKYYLGLCPFHSEKTPSFTVTPDKQIFYCFGCHTGGNVFSFLMKKENLTFYEAVERLARKYGIPLPEKELSPHEREQQKRRRRWEEIQDWAASYFHDVLLRKPEGEPGRQYFAKRGIDENMIISFRLGFAPDRWDGLIQALGERGVSPQELVEAGLVIARDTPGTDGRQFYDRFRNRVIFSILDRRQRPIAFGGRVLDDSLPKYLNSPETTFFSKGNHLYGMHRAHQGIREEGFALLVEGYMDVIAVHKAGLANAVASLGTALTKEQAKLLKRYTGRVVICYDSDAAGVQAALRGGEILRDMGLRVDVLTLTEAKDPDEFIKTFGLEEFRQALAHTLTYIEFKYHTLVKEKPPAAIPEKAELVAKLAPDILKVNSPVEREGYERFLSQKLGLSLEAVQREIESQAQKKQQKVKNFEYSRGTQDISVKKRDNIIRYEKNESPIPALTVPQGVYRAEQMILKILLENRSLMPRVSERLGETFWRFAAHREIYNQLAHRETTEIPANLGLEAQSVLAGLLIQNMDMSKSERILDDCIRVILESQRDETLEELQSRIAVLEKSGDMAGAMALLREIGERLKRGEK